MIILDKIDFSKIDYEKSELKLKLIMFGYVYAKSDFYKEML